MTNTFVVRKYTSRPFQGATYVSRTYSYVLPVPILFTFDVFIRPARLAG